MAKQKGNLPEVEALGTILTALAELDGTQRTWVLASVAAKLEIAIPEFSASASWPEPTPSGTWSRDRG